MFFLEMAEPDKPQRPVAVQEDKIGPLPAAGDALIHPGAVGFGGNQLIGEHEAAHMRGIAAGQQQRRVTMLQGAQEKGGLIHTASPSRPGRCRAYRWRRAPRRPWQGALPYPRSAS